MPKISIDAFVGVAPKVPAHALPNGGASVALNARLTNSSIRGYFEMEDSGFSIEDMDVNGGSDTFFRAGPEDAIAWMQWNHTGGVTVLETRYNNITAYTYPDNTTVSILSGDFPVSISGDDATFTEGLFEAVVSDVTTTEYDFANLEFTPPAPTLLMTTIVSADIRSPGVEPGSAYTWTKLSGGAITFTGGISNTQSVGLEATVSAPTEPAQDGSTDVVVTAVFEVAVTDAGVQTGTQRVTVTFTRSWEPQPIPELPGLGTNLGLGSSI